METLVSLGQLVLIIVSIPIFFIVYFLVMIFIILPLMAFILSPLPAWNWTFIKKSCQNGKCGYPLNNAFQRIRHAWECVIIGKEHPTHPSRLIMCLISFICTNHFNFLMDSYYDKGENMQEDVLAAVQGCKGKDFNCKLNNNK